MDLRKKINNLIWLLRRVNVKTLIFNFKYLEFRDASKLPFLIAPNTLIKGTGNFVIESDELYFGMVRIGFTDVGIFDKRVDKTVIENNGKIFFENSAHIGRGSRISAMKNSKLYLCDNFNNTASCNIICSHNIKFGRNCLLSWGTVIMDTDFHKINYSKDSELPNEINNVMIGDQVWICSDSTILKGSVIGKNTVIATKSLVSNKSFESNSLIAGIPAKKIKSIYSWEI